VIGVLALIGLTNLITASFAGLRDHLRDVNDQGASGRTGISATCSTASVFSLPASR